MNAELRRQIDELRKAIGWSAPSDVSEAYRQVPPPAEGPMGPGGAGPLGPRPLADGARVHGAGDRGERGAKRPNIDHVKYLFEFFPTSSA